jgi:hypothetical protein
MADIKLSCRCGGIEGLARNISPQSCTRLVCHCRDCQAFARALDAGDETLDEFGGTDIVQVAPARIMITRGASQLRCLRLTPKGLIRWYAGCCKTPVANTVSAGMPFVGLIHTFLEDAVRAHETTGPVRYYVQGRYALSGRPDDDVHPAFPPAMLFRVVIRMLTAKFGGDARPSPFFDAAGKPMMEPDVLTSGRKQSRIGA